MPSIKTTGLTIAVSRNGRGIFTTREFAAGQTVFEVTGRLITCDEDEDVDDETRSNAYRYDENLYLSPKGRIGDFLNHSCNPNARVVKKGKKLFIEAIKTILPGKEVLIDYSTITAADDTWKMKCNCGSAKCRKNIGSFRSLPKEIKQRYLQKEIVPRYILTI